MRTIWGRAALVTVMSVLPAFASPSDEPIEPQDASLDALAITRDEQDTYSLTVDGDTVTAAAAPDNVGGNTRVVFRPSSAVPTVNQASCATWEEPQEDARQPGAGLRIQYGDGTFRAVMISKNVWERFNWSFNVHLVDSSQDPPLTAMEAVTLEEVFLPGGRLVAAPWRMCVAAVGLELGVKVWPLSHPEPEWGDERYGTVLQLPEGWDYPGHAGWYIGHLKAGESATFSDVSTTGMSLGAYEQRVQQEIAAAIVTLRP